MKAAVDSDGRQYAPEGFSLIAKLEFLLNHLLVCRYSKYYDILATPVVTT